MSEIKSSTHEDLVFDGEAMSSIFEDTDCWLVALDDWEIAVILSSLRYAHWPRRWRNLGSHTWAEIEAKICGLEYCLMAGCNVGELLDKFDTLNETLLTLAGRFVTPEDKGIAEVVEDLELTCDTTVNFDTAAIVEAVEALELTCGDTEVNFDTAAIVVAIEAQTTLQETRSIAEVTAQNTNFSDLVEAVDGLELVANCAPDVNLSCSPDVTVISGGAGGETGTTMPHDPGTIGEEPPTGYEPYAPEIVDETTCKIANAIVDEIRIALQAFIDQNILNTIRAGAWFAALTIGYVLAGPIMILGLSLDVVGFITGILKSLVPLEDSDLTELINLLTDYEEEFVCILYNGQNGDSVLDVKDAFNQALLAHEANTYQRALMDVFLAVDVLNNLYWQPTWALNGKTVEEWLDGYEGSVGCGVCGEDVIWTEYNNQGYACTITRQDGTGIDVSSIQGALWEGYRASEIFLTPSEAVTIHVEYTGTSVEKSYQVGSTTYPVSGMPASIEVAQGQIFGLYHKPINPLGHGTPFTITITYPS